MTIPATKPIEYLDGDLPFSVSQLDDEGLDKYVIVRCHYSGAAYDPRSPDSYSVKADFDRGLGACPYCLFKGTLTPAPVVPSNLWKGDEDKGYGFFPLHGRALDKHEQAERTIEAVAATLGYARMDRPTLNATSAATSRSNRIETVDEMVAIGVGILSASVAKRSALGDATRAFADLANLRVGHSFIGFPEATQDYVTDEDYDAPFFSEAFLYPLLGKEAARTVLARWHSLEAALAASRKDSTS